MEHELSRADSNLLISTKVNIDRIIRDIRNFDVVVDCYRACITLSWVEPFISDLSAVLAHLPGPYVLPLENLSCGSKSGKIVMNKFSIEITAPENLELERTIAIFVADKRVL